MRTREERELLRNVSWDAFWRHYNECDPTVEEEFDLWGPYHQQRHEMRYDLVAAEVRRHLPSKGRVLDLGCGGALVADRIRDADATYIGFDFGGPHIEYASKKGFMDISMQTNGLLMTERISERLLDSGLTRLHVSLDAFTKGD